MVLEPICCPSCNSTNVVKNGKSDEGKQRYRCRNTECSRRSFIREYSYRGYLPDVKQQQSGHGGEWQWHPRYGTSAENQPNNCD